MTIEYDTDIEKYPYQGSKYVSILQQFRHQTEHESISMSFEDKQNAIRVQKSFCQYRSLHRIHDVNVYRRGNVLVLVKNSEVISCK